MACTGLRQAVGRCWCCGVSPDTLDGNDATMTLENPRPGPTLVLNRNWQPVNVATVWPVRRALLWNESARNGGHLPHLPAPHTGPTGSKWVLPEMSRRSGRSGSGYVCRSWSPVTGLATGCPWPT